MPLPLIGYGIAVVGKKTIFTVLAQVAKIIVALVVTTKTGEIQIKRVVPALYKIWVLNNEIKNECKKSNTTKQELKKVTKEANEIAKSLGQKKEIIAKELDDFANFYENVLKKQIYMNMEIIDINFPEIDTSELKKYYATIVAAKDSIKGISSGVFANLLAYGGIIKINGIAGYSKIAAKLAPILTEIWPLVSPVIISEIVAKNLENTVENLTEKTNSTKKKNEENSGNSKSIIKKINEICRVTKDINDSLNEIERVYTEYFADIKNFCKEDKSYFDYTEVEREKIKNTILLVKLLSELCRTTPVKKRYEYDYEDINCSDANKVVTNVRAEFEKIKRR